MIKRFVCADVNPGCGMVFQGLDDDGITERAVEHATEAHGGSTGEDVIRAAIRPL